MTTEYTNNIIIATPESLMTEANHLACLMGESSYDIDTFNIARWMDTAGNRYAVTYTVVKPIFFSPLQTTTLPPTPEHAVGIVDRDLAQAAFDSMNSSGGILFAYDVDFKSQLKAWGLIPIPVAEEEVV